MNQPSVSIRASSKSIRSATGRLSRFVQGWWRWLREVTGDAAYDRYLAARGCPTPRPPLTEGEFYLDRLRRRYSSINRCC
ncbi:MAG TPA: YbdD/YjiX family protein [Candidatus Acidoferrales bacterium]|nr:YbdD/YjiX family protein [Candidatus Acidoferrales bacterium]